MKFRKDEKAFKKATGIALLVLLAAFLLIVGCGRKQDVSFGYSFTISPTKGEVLKDVTVYLPFPTKEGKPTQEIFDALMRDYRKYAADDHPDAKISLESTKYGSMLKVSISKLDHRGFGLGGGYGYEEPYSDKQIAPHFMLNPRKNVRKLPDGFGHVSDTYVYADFKGGEELGLALEYSISILSPALFPLDYVPEDGCTSYLGFEEPPTESGSRVKYVNRQGWSKMPLSNTNYDGESYEPE
ncbi:MAG: hypothetical protein Q8J63_03600 [Candidatus Aquicultor sp.]|nr:hypothetical protein [Candidatus Aquicultor sp.]